MDNVRQKTSMQDIADALNISKNAVSLALNNKSGISETLRNKVVQTAILMNYGGYGKLGNSSGNNLVAICVPSAISGFSQFYSSVYWAIEKELSAHGYRSLLTSITQEMEHNLSFPEVLHEQGLKGVIVVGVISKEYILKMVNSFNNFVQVDNYYMDLAINSVATANVEGGYEATKFLVEQGAERIGFVGDIHAYNSYKDRYRGYELALSDVLIPKIPSRFFTDSALFSPTLQLDILMEKMKEEQLDAIFCASDRIAIQLIGMMHKNGLQIPQDISIIGFDDTENSDIVNPPLTTMRVPRTELGHVAATLLIEKIASKRKPPSAISIYPKLIQRKSVLMKHL